MPDPATRHCRVSDPIKPEMNSTCSGLYKGVKITRRNFRIIFKNFESSFKMQPVSSQDLPYIFPISR